MNKVKLYDGLATNAGLKQRAVVYGKENCINPKYFPYKGGQLIDYDSLYVEQDNIIARFWRFDEAKNDCRFCMYENVSGGEVFYVGNYSELTTQIASNFKNATATSLAYDIVAFFQSFQQP